MFMHEKSTDFSLSFPNIKAVSEIVFCMSYYLRKFEKVIF